MQILSTLSHDSTTRGQKLVRDWLSSIDNFYEFMESFHDRHLDIYEPSHRGMRLRKRTFHSSLPYPHHTFVTLEKRDGFLYGITYLIQEMHPLGTYPISWQWSPTVCKK